MIVFESIIKCYCIRIRLISIPDVSLRPDDSTLLGWLPSFPGENLLVFSGLCKATSLERTCLLDWVLTGSMISIEIIGQNALVVKAIWCSEAEVGCLSI